VILLIVGTGRSGTTILEKTLGSFSNAVAIGEVSFIWERGVIGNYRCSDGIRFRDHPFWQRVLARAFPEGISASEQLALSCSVERSRAFPFLLLGRRRRAVESYARAWRRLYDAIAAEAGSRLLVDASKSPVRALVLARSGFDVRVLHVVRNLADVVRSWQRAKFDPATDSFIPTKHAAVVAGYWILHNTISATLSNFAPYYRINFSRFLRNPQACTEEIWLKLGISDPGQSPFVSARGVVVKPDFAFSGNPDRFHSGPIAIRPPPAPPNAAAHRQR
jgi:hypothetical protein